MARAAPRTRSAIDTRAACPKRGLSEAVPGQPAVPFCPFATTFDETNTSWATRRPSPAPRCHPAATMPKAALHRSLRWSNARALLAYQGLSALPGSQAIDTELLTHVPRRAGPVLHRKRCSFCFYTPSTRSSIVRARRGAPDARGGRSPGLEQLVSRRSLIRPVAPVDANGISQVSRRSVPCLCPAPRPRPSPQDLAFGGLVDAAPGQPKPKASAGT